MGTPQTIKPCHLRLALNRTSKRVVLSLGEATPNGIPVTLQIGDEGQLPTVETTGWLPSVEHLLSSYAIWKATYRQLDLSQMRLSMPAVQVTNVSFQERKLVCDRAQKSLRTQLNSWLNADLFRPVKETLLAYLHPSESIRLTLKTNNLEIQQLPLHLWDWFDRYVKAELVVSNCNTASVSSRSSVDWSAGVVKVLVILGDSRGLNLEHDLSLLEAMPNVEVTCLRDSVRSNLNDALWENRWDVILFAGHSTADHQLRINKTETLRLKDLRHGLTQAIKNDLKLLILNTCDSLQLIEDLGCSVPSIIAMRELVPDRVAHSFLKYFLSASARGNTITQSVRIARERLQGIEGQYPFATWLPILCE
ncbi:MAG: CHAT domain-containing protein [Cyanobacteria bacterium J06643_4]